MKKPTVGDPGLNQTHRGEEMEKREVWTLTNQSGGLVSIRATEQECQRDGHIFSNNFLENFSIQRWHLEHGPGTAQIYTVDREKEAGPV